MAVIKPFRALKPAVHISHMVASRPYDVINSAEAKIEVQDNPNSFLHITKAEVDLPTDIDTHTPQVYEKAKSNLNKFIDSGILIQDGTECYYIYELTMNNRVQTGLVCVSAVEDYFNNIIKKHEFTRPDKEKDRIDHMATIKAQTGNVFLAYRNVTAIDTIIEDWKSVHDPVFSFSTQDGVLHRTWTIDNKETINRITELFHTQVAATYIADGHHRAASAAKVSTVVGTDNARYFLTTIFPQDQLSIMDYNRVVKDLNGATPQQFLDALQQDFIVEEAPKAVQPQQLHQFGLYIQGKWYSLQSRAGTYTQDPIGVLDVTILSQNILEKHLAIIDQRTDKRIDFVGGIRGLAELERRVDSGEMAVAFSLYPVSLQQLFDIADSGEVMPPKSTWFEPKLRDGLFTHLLYE